MSKICWSCQKPHRYTNDKRNGIWHERSVEEGKPITEKDGVPEAYVQRVNNKCKHRKADTINFTEAIPLCDNTSVYTRVRPEVSGLTNSLRWQK